MKACDFNLFQSSNFDGDLVLTGDILIVWSYDGNDRMVSNGSSRSVKQL